MGFFQDLFGDTAAKADRQAAATAAQGYRAGQAYAEPLYGQAKTDLSQGFGQAAGAWQPVADVGNAGAKFYADITGVNGPAAQAAASSSFQTDPGYQFALTQSEQAAERQGSKYGQLDSGNLIDAVQQNAAGLASKQYNDWVSRLQPFLQYSALGAAGLSDAYKGQGTGLAGLDTGLANLGYGTETGAAGALAAGQKAAGADQTAGAQFGANLGAKLLGYALAPFTGGTSALLANAGAPFMGGGSPSGYGR